MALILEELRKAVLHTAKEMDRLRLTRGTSGNVSAFDAESRLVAITPSAMPYASMEIEDIIVVDLQGHVVHGRNKPSSETPMHTAIYGASQNGYVPRAAAGQSMQAEAGDQCDNGQASATRIRAIVHTHSPFATAFAVMNRELPPITVPLALLGKVPIVGFHLPGSDELASAAAAVIGQCAGRLTIEDGRSPTQTPGHVNEVRDTVPTIRCCLLQNHGLVCTGADLDAALEAAVYVEEGSEVAIYVLSAGGELTPIAEEFVETMRTRGMR